MDQAAWILPAVTEGPSSPGGPVCGVCVGGVLHALGLIRLGGFYGWNQPLHPNKHLQLRTRFRDHQPHGVKAAASAPSV